jgi:uncharacterized membrane protein
VAESYRVVFTGKLQPGAVEDVAVAAFSSRFGTPEDKVRHLLSANREVTLKADLQLAEAERYLAALDRMGLAVRLDPPPEAANSEPPAPAADAKELALEPVPERESGAAPEAESDPRHDPFATPQAELDDDQGEGEMHAPVSVPAGHGWRWLADGFELFKRNPVAWIGAMVVWFAVSMVLGLIPLVSLAVSLLSGVIAGGFMLGAHEQDEGGDFRVGHVFAGFSSNFGSLLLLGVMYLVGIFIIGGAMGIMVGGSVAAATGGENPDPAMIQSLLSGPGVLVPLLIGLTLITMLVMAYWFAPALVALEGVSAVSAMALSFKACLKNVLPFLVYGLAAMVLVVLGALPVFLGLLVVIPMITASIYTGYRDIFYS